MTIIHRAKSPSAHFRLWTDYKLKCELQRQIRRGDDASMLCALCYGSCCGNGPCADCCRGEIERRKRGGA